MHKHKNNQDIAKYIGLAFQIMASLSFAVYIGFKLDAYLKCSPIFIIAFALLTLASIFYKIFKDFQ
jgi:F0F1-type ATP synthase assembly protein I